MHRNFIIKIYFDTVINRGPKVPNGPTAKFENFKLKFWKLPEKDISPQISYLYGYVLFDFIGYGT